MIDHSTAHAWQAVNDRLHALIREGDCDQHAAAFRAYVMADAGADRWAHVTAQRLDDWSVRLAEYGPTARAEWMERRLVRAVEDGYGPFDGYEGR